VSFAASAQHPDAGTGETKATLRRRKSFSRTSVLAALIGDLLVAASKIVAALWTGSAAMTSEAIHSVVDTTNEILLLYGIHRSKQKADADHPFGYGREIYFWSFVVSLLIFALGAGFSIYVGVNRILTPVPIESPVVSYRRRSRNRDVAGNARSGPLITIESLRRAQSRRSYAATFLLPLPRRFHERNFGPKFGQQKVLENDVFSRA